VEEILINVTPRETRVAVLEAGAAQELLIERSASRGQVGNIYRGRVARVLPGMQSAFVDIGLERAAFLHVADLGEHRKGGEARPIEKLLAEGQPQLVQVLKDPLGSKGARLSTQVSLAGRLLVYLPAALRCSQMSATCRNAARSRPMSTKADCMPGSTRATRPM
jgi:ribonuclease G